jgi:hypothetical protein
MYSMAIARFVNGVTAPYHGQYAKSIGQSSHTSWPFPWNFGSPLPIDAKKILPPILVIEKLTSVRCTAGFPSLQT